MSAKRRYKKLAILNDINIEILAVKPSVELNEVLCEFIISVLTERRACLRLSSMTTWKLPVDGGGGGGCGE